MAELLIVVSTFLLTFLGLGAAGIAYAGPFAVAAGVVAMGVALRGRADGWASVGLVWPFGGRVAAYAAPTKSGGVGRFVLASLGCLLAGWTGAAVGTVLATRGFGWAPIDTARFAGIAGNPGMLLGMLAISWTTAAFGEEVLFRGFLQSRLRALLGDVRFAGLLAAVGQAVVFGLAHFYQGPTGIVVTGCVGLAFGLCRLRLKSVWPLVVAHGLIDTVAMVAMYLGAKPAA